MWSMTRMQWLVIFQERLQTRGRAGDENPFGRGSHANGDGSLFVDYG